MLKNIGIMQGRLLPKYQGRYQAHPLGYWEKEFPIASKLGLDSIEFILDFNNVEENPLLAPGGIESIQRAEQNSGIKVRSICADYFMEAPIHSEDIITVDKSISVLQRLIKNASLMNVQDIVIPCVDQSSLKNDNSKSDFINNIKKVTYIAEEVDINICLETDLAPIPFANLIDLIGSKNVTINYDIGNSAAMGYDPIEEFRAYGDKISDLHIKDRLIGSGPVPLGKGNADFSKIFDLLSKYNYQGLLIFQAYRDNEGVEIFKDQLNWFFKNIEL
jgi:sugar phosphate isomerase/epimerase